MPSRKDWLDLIRSTFHAVGRKDISGLYGREWQRARAKLTADHAHELERPGGRVKRFFRTSNAVLFGLSRRLAPARRVLFATALLCLLFSFQGPSFLHSTHKHGNVLKTTEYHFYFDNGWLFIALVVVVLLLAMELVDKINFRDELELARDLQASLIPNTLPAIPGWELGAHNEIANTVGGDIYDFVPLPDGRLAVLFGDASGHGMAAGLVMAVAHASFRTQLDIDPAPEAMFATLNRILCRTGGPRAFFSCVYLLLSPDGAYQGTVAGHPPVLKLSAEGAVLARIGKGAYPLGIRTPLSWEVEAGRLESRERLLLYSDGVSEGRDAAGVEFGEERVIPIARVGAGLYPPDLVEALARELRVFRGDEAPEDDVSITVIGRL
ncbi:MAG: PP2C family protein-serine/threonine phosphatase [Acidobacteriota bacterium]